MSHSPNRKRLLLGACVALAGCLVWGAGYVLFFPRLAPFVMPLVKGELDTQQCLERIDDLKTKLEPLAAGPGLQLPVRVDLPRAPGNPPMHHAPILEVAPRGHWFAGEELSNDAFAAGRQVAEWMEQNGASLEPGPALYLAADRGMRMREIAPLLQGVSEARIFLMTQPEEAEITPPLGAKQFAKDFERAVTDAERAAIASASISVMAGPCAPLARRLARFHEVPPQERATTLLNYLEDGLRECSCGRVDLDALEYVLLQTMRHPSGPPTVLEVSLHRSGENGTYDLDWTVERFAQSLVARDPIP